MRVLITAVLLLAGCTHTTTGVDSTRTLEVWPAPPIFLTNDCTRKLIVVSYLDELSTSILASWDTPATSPLGRRGVAAFRLSPRGDVTELDLSRLPAGDFRSSVATAFRSHQPWPLPSGAACLLRLPIELTFESSRSQLGI